MPQISVIVPVYNAEKYLIRCIDSILIQSFPNFELLLIDDGSKDSSGQICDEYATKDSRVRVFHKENGGVSSARNFGLDKAQGEWICFVDSDDEIQNLEVLSSSKLDSDIILFSLRMDYKDGRTYCDPLLPLSKALDTKEMYIKAYLHYHVFSSVCAKLIRRSVLKDLRFDTTIKFGEDALYNLKLMNLVNKITICNEIAYVYNRFEDYGVKYQDSIENSINTMSQIFEAYWALQCRNHTFERNVFNCYRTICQKEWVKNPSLWNENEIVSSVYLRIKDAYPVCFRIKYRLITSYIYRILRTKKLNIK